MSTLSRAATRRRLAAATAALAVGAGALAGCTGTEGQSTPAAAGMIAYLDYGGFGGGSNPQANYNPFLAATRLGATDYLFEKLMQFDNFSCDPKPWLATAYAWTDPKTLRFTLRDGVRWNDGKPFTAADVAFTFGLLKNHDALDDQGVWRYLSAVTAPDPKTVVMSFDQPGASAFTLVNNVPIVPEHVWSAVKDPVTFVNADKPVGTGPFTVKSFTPQQLTIARNPAYWQADKVKVQELRFHKSDEGGQVDQLRLSRGEYDTNSMFVQDIKKTYVDRDPEHFHYWYPPGGAIAFYMNLTKAPFDDVAFRRALSFGFDHKRITDQAELGYVVQASQTGLVIPGQEDWVPQGVGDQGRLPFDPDRADRELTAAGYAKDVDGKRLGKDRKPMSFTFKVPGGYTDWVSAARIVVDNLRTLGIDVQLQTPTPEIYENDRAIGSYDTLFGVQGGSCNMYRNFAEPLAGDQSAPVGTKAKSNFVRWQDPATDGLLDQLRTATDEAGQKQAVTGLSRVMLDQVPMIPLWYGAKWFQYSTRKATGWPDAHDPYASPSDNLLIITHLRPANG